MRRFKVTAGIFAALLAVSACGGTESSTEPNRENYPDLFASIDEIDDCVELQRINDQAWENHQELSDRDGPLPARREQTAYLSATDDRMELLGCYEEDE